MQVSYAPLCGEYALAAAEIEKQCLHTPWSKQQIEALPENAAYFCALRGNIPVGIISAYFVLDEIQIMNLAVLPQYRGNKIGYGLLQCIFSLGAEKNSKFITLEVAKNNLSAISLYQKCGFVPVGKRKNFYGSISAVLMEKQL